MPTELKEVLLRSADALRSIAVDETDLLDVGDLRLLADRLDELEADAARWRALMTMPRIKMQGSAGVNALTGVRAPGSAVHFGAEFWTEFDIDQFPDLSDGIQQSTAWGRYALTACADALIEKAEGVTRGQA